ncbi:MAG TPA: DUF1566 domain-containing protein [Xanthobacteraceae bacterium]|nr:DUF1566 domain-containing protein [Xanthobacteraceae bacterium]
MNHVPAGRRARFVFAAGLSLLAGTAAMASGLIPQPNGTVYDANQNVTWLTDANFAASPQGRAILAAAHITGVEPSGIMDYQTAVLFVQAMNTVPCGGRGYLCRNDWQLPVTITTPAHDPTCTVHRGFDGNSFGPNCRESAFGNMFYRGLGRTYPSSIVPYFRDAVAGLHDLHPALYWSATPGGATGQQTFSFLTGQYASSTTLFNLLHVLPVHHGLLPGSTIGADAHGVSRYIGGPAAGLAVYDTASGLSWPLDANLAATQPFGVTGTITIPAKPNHDAITMPLIAAGGAVHFQGVAPWLGDLNSSRYAGAQHWVLPTLDELETLYAHLGLSPGNASFLARGLTEPFYNFQPFFYWACPEIEASPTQCDYARVLKLRDNIAMRWSFNFDTGFQGTSQETKRYYVTLYHPGR